jgi:hypothetical protein
VLPLRTGPPIRHVLTCRTIRIRTNIVLVQREMESCRSPLASIQPFSAGQFGGLRRCSGGEWTKAGC